MVRAPRRLAGLLAVALLASTFTAEAAPRRRTRKAKPAKTAPAPTPPASEEAPPEGAAASKPAVSGDAPTRSVATEDLAAEPTKPALLASLPQVTFTRHRYAFIGAGVLLAGGVALGYSAQGEAKRAQTISSAREAQRSLDGARQSAATATALFGLGLATLGYAVVMELLPQPPPDQSQLTFQF